MIKNIADFLKKETILILSGILATISCFLVPPDMGYAGYIDKNTILILFCLMAVMSGLKSLGFFKFVGEFLLNKIGSARGVVFVLVFLCFFGSMLITNDVALITFVPLAILILGMAEMNARLCFVITFMTIAANLGSMLTPIGNPQNLYLYTVSGISLGNFVLTMLPCTLLSAVLISVCIWFQFHSEKISIDIAEKQHLENHRELICYLILFLLCLGAVLDFLPVEALFIIIVIAILFINWKILLQIDYSLLATFIFFFIFIGNMKRFPAFYEFILTILGGHERIVSIGISQVISNVPAALLLSGFTDQWKELMLGTNIGGLGTLIASMASLISYKQIARQYPEQKTRYFIVFTLWNVVFLILLTLFSMLW